RRPVRLLVLKEVCRSLPVQGPELLNPASPAGETAPDHRRRDPVAHELPGVLESPADHGENVDKRGSKNRRRGNSPTPGRSRHASSITRRAILRSVVQMTRAMAAHHGTEGIRVNCINRPRHGLYADGL